MSTHVTASAEEAVGRALALRRQERGARDTASAGAVQQRGTITILAADDHPLIRAGLSALLELEPDMHVVGEASNGEEAQERYRALRPDVVVMDLRMPVMDGLAACEAIIAEFPDARVVMLTTYDGDEDIYRSLDAGAKGYVLKDMLRAEVVKVIRTVHAGRRGIPSPVAARLAEFTPRMALTPREREVLLLVSKGFSNPEIGRIIGRTEGTVKIHVQNILQKLKVTDRTEAVMVGAQRGFIRIT
jgi:two-component system NarL family response regulator